MINESASFLDIIRSLVRGVVRKFARLINFLSRGKISPNNVTITGLIAHILIGVLIALRHNLIAAILLIIFGLFDSLDGELARLQKKDSVKGMLLDAVTDRFKEVMIFTAIGYNLMKMGNNYALIWVILACGVSQIVSYTKAKGEVAFLSTGHSSKKINTVFTDGFMRFEVRMSLIILGLIFNKLSWAVIVIAVAAIYTAIQRLMIIINKIDV